MYTISDTQTLNYARQSRLQQAYFVKGVERASHDTLTKSGRVLCPSRANLALDLMRHHIASARAESASTKLASASAPRRHDGCAMSISPTLRATARAAYRDFLRASAVTFAGDATLKSGTLHQLSTIQCSNQVVAPSYSLQAEVAQRDPARCFDDRPESVRGKD